MAVSEANMTDAEKRLTVQTLLGNEAEATSELVGVYLADAKMAILNRIYPFGIPTTVTEVPDRYAMLQCRLAQRYFLKQGAEGETVHNENGIKRTYNSANDEDLLGVIVPKAKV